MSALSDKFAKAKLALAERSADKQQQAPVSASPVPIHALAPGRVSGPQHGSVTTMKMEMLKAEIETLKSGKPSILIDAREIRPSEWANRLSESFKTSEFAAHKAEISSAGGNKQPIKVRPISDSGEFKFEVVFGHRRHRACLELGIPVLAIVDSLDDRDLFIEMDRENRAREDLTPYEQGVMYARALEKGLFSSLRKMAEEIGEDASNVSKAVSLARLPGPVLDSFVSRLDVQYRWGAALKAAVEKEPDLMLARAADIAKQRAAGKQISSQQAFDILIGKSFDSAKQATRNVAVGDYVLRVTESNKKLTFEMPALSPEKRGKIEKYITDLLSK